MKICILEDSYDYSQSPLKELDPPADPLPYLQEHTCERHCLRKATAVQQVIELAHRDFDLFLNLCDGAWDEDRPGIEVVQTLERLGVPFTGANAAFYEPSRETMKMVCRMWGIRTPAYVMATADASVAFAAGHLRFPLIVKHPSSYASIGLTRHSRVETPAALHAEAARAISAYGAALIEEFIDGREFTVLVAENADDPRHPFAYLPVEFQFAPSESFKHFDLKWKTYATMTCVPCTDAALSERLQEMARRLFVGLNGTSYGRCDMRMNAAGDLYVLEINPNCGIFYPPSAEGSADLILLHDPRGHAHFVNAILNAAIKRSRQVAPKWQIYLDSQQRYGMFAVGSIAEGDVIAPFEEMAQVLVSRTHVEHNWDADQRAWFADHAHPLSENVYALWNNLRGSWQPVRHACDPNAWVTGLNLTARRPIAAGNEITIDYATLGVGPVTPFVCTCGAANCRQWIHPDDYAQDFVRRYGEHVSDYVRVKRAARAL
ncbi:MAG: hypothetical protein KDE54_04955 [Caldilineaceae bacterium]|nr:hypothetical protein [Caldilineaceae bacterium]